MTPSAPLPSAAPPLSSPSGPASTAGVEDPAPRTVAVGGGTGAVGQALVQRLLAHPGVAGVRALVRRPGALPAHPKLREIVLDWDAPTAGETLKAVLDGVADAYCALGTTLKQAGSRSAFEKVDYHYVVEYARAARAAGVARFLLVSALGAKEKSPFFYSRVKGRAEQAVTTLEFAATVIAQPSLLLTARRPDDRPGEALAQKLMPALNPLLQGPLAASRAVPADTVAASLVRAAFAGTTQGVVRLRAPFAT